MRKFGKNGGIDIMEFTKNQKKAIDLRNRNILVSASAGTGKTAVLTERIVRILLDRDNYEDIDRMLVVTFTRAAAAEMRARISTKLSERYEDAKRNGEDADYIEHISRQLALLPNSRITTIDSLCYYILKKYYYAIGIDPAVKIIDEKPDRLMLLKVIDDVLERKYDERTDSFVTMVESIITVKKDKDLIELIEKLYNNSMSHADPVGWLLRSVKGFRRYSSIKEVDEASWMKESMFVFFIKFMIHDVVNTMDEAISLCSKDNVEGVLDKVIKQLTEERDMIDRITRNDSFSTISAALAETSFDKLSFPKSDLLDAVHYDGLKGMIKNLRSDAKDALRKIIKQYVPEANEVTLEEIALCEVPMKELVNITIEVIDELDALKKQENVASFSDVAHYALQIIENEDILGELRKTFDHVLIDEYQDSNEIQETLLAKLSREAQGQNNRFMVGDSKQSIYMFRLADPEIFEEKNREYTEEESEFQKVYLDSNFRSSDAILEGVNYLFEQLMSRTFGGVDYTGGHAFKIDPEINVRKNAGPNEIIYVSGNDLPEISEFSKQELEAAAVAKKIREITDPVTGMTIYDEELERERTVRFSDIAILLRSKKGWAENFNEALATNKIPVITEETTGYFASFEIQAILSMLKIVDNPYQDIPFTAALTSSYGDFTDEELAGLVAKAKKESDGKSSIPMYEIIKECSEMGSSPLNNKCKVFIDRLESLRRKAPYMKVSEIIVELAGMDNFEDCVNVMQGGDRRSGNLKMLIQKAYEYETANSCFELFGFLQFLETMQNADIDFGEAPYEQFGEGAVTIMSIHKSKGLEFPVVFVSGLNKGFNYTDKRNSTVVHSKMGLGPQVFYPEERVRKNTLIKQAIQLRMSIEMLSEELRVLYVALTRAKNKLFMTGYVKNAAEFIEDNYSGRVNFLKILSEKATYLSWITSIAPNRDDLFRISIVPADAAIIRYKDHVGEIKNKRKALEDYIKTADADSKVLKMIDEQKKYKYPFEEETCFAVKVSVSEIKHDRAVEEDEEGVKASWLSTERPKYVPRFAGGEAENGLTGAERGTMYHTVMQYIDMEKVSSKQDIILQIKEMIGSGKLPPEALTEHVISFSKILKFCKSDVAARMIDAGRRNRLFLEQPFVMGVPASMVYRETDSEETIIVQGIIDVFFEEDDGMVLLDYKTDRVEFGDEQVLVNRYKAQMDNYKMAIEKGMGKKVKEIILYSFSLGSSITL